MVFTRYIRIPEQGMYFPNFKDTIAASPYIFTLGVAGDSGSGKTTFTEGIRSIFGSDLVSTITLDDYHSLDRDGRRKQGLTALNPKANRIDQTRTGPGPASDAGRQSKSPSIIIQRGYLILRSSSARTKSSFLKGFTHCSHQRCENTSILPYL